MAFYYYTSDSIREIDPEVIPESFRDYFDGLSQELKEDIKEYHPILYEQLMEGDNNEEQDDFDLFEDSELSIEEQKIIDKWERISIKEWHKDRINAEVLVCKIMPTGNRRCRMHRIDLIQKQINYITNGVTFSHYGYLCPECMSLYIDEEKIEGITSKLDSKNIKMWIQPLEDTLEEWNEYVEPLEITENTIYVPDSWSDVDMKCPEDMGTLAEDSYKKEFANHEVRFEAYKCSKCNKLMMRNSLAQQLSLQCGRVGVPDFEYIKVRPKQNKKIDRVSLYRPDYFVANGEKNIYEYNDKEWEELSESSNFVVAYSRVCSFEDHDTDDQLVLVKVTERNGLKKEYLILVGYCEDCQKYYIAKEDYEVLYNAGRPHIKIYDDTSSDFYIQSGAVFDEEKGYLEIVEGKLSNKINELRTDSNYVSTYEVNSGGYDDGDLSFRKEKSKHISKKIEEWASFISNPYGYRVELYNDDESLIFYLGAEKLEIDGEKVISFSTDFGREMVNYRTIAIDYKGKKYKVKRRRQFDINKAVLYGYLEQSDEDAIFREGLTDPYLMHVLNTRKRQHQLVDIMFTIQENQNSIIDVPLEKNIIVQGCAGSGKTMVMLQRLSALKHGKQEFAFDRILILTPNDNFNLHINGVASSLQIGYVNRVSIERYYIGLLLKYDESFKPKYAIVDEINVNQVYVNYMYSDDFIKVFWNSYKDVLESMNDFILETRFYASQWLENNYYQDIDCNSVLVMLAMINEFNRKIESICRLRGEEVDKNEVYARIITTDITQEERSRAYKYFDKIRDFSVKKIFQAVYDEASQRADDILYRKTGRKYLGATKGTHRYDLYLQLQFALRFFEKKVGNNNLICIDEGQDLAVSEYKLIIEINHDKPIINVFGDTNQLLKPGRGIFNWKQLLDVIGEAKQFSLSENFRNTNQITQFCNNIFNMNVVQTGVDGRKVNEIIRSKFESTLAMQEIGDARIAVLLPRQVKKKDYIDEEQLPIDIRENVGEQIGNGRITVSYVDEVKGIEFDKVYVVPNGMTQNEKYIAYTRALSELTVVFDDELEERIRKKEEERKRKQEEIEKENDTNRKPREKSSSNIKYGKVSNNKQKAEKYMASETAYTYICKRCSKKIILTKQEVKRLQTKDYEMPKMCPNCKKQLEQEISVGKCVGCKKDIIMTRGKYEHLKKKKKLPNRCESCTASMKGMEEKTCTTKVCVDCKRRFAITYKEKWYCEHNKYNLPIRCKSCRKKRKDFFS